MHATHEVLNQPSPLVDYNLFATNRPLRDALKLNAPQLDTAPLHALGAAMGTAAMQTHARLANVHTPELRSHDRFGRRIDEVEFHPSYHALMSTAVGAGLHGTPWAEHGAPTLGTGVSSLPPEGALAPRGGPSALGASPHVLRAAGFMLFTETEPSILCPISMTYAATPALRRNAAIHADWGSRLTSRVYDPALKVYRQKAGVTMGMGMTEKQGGSDVRANTTQAAAGRQRRVGPALSPHRPQVVLLGPDVRRLPGAGAKPRRPFLLLPAARAAGWHARTRSTSSA